MSKISEIGVCRGLLIDPVVFRRAIIRSTVGKSRQGFLNALADVASRTVFLQ